MIVAAFAINEQNSFSAMVDMVEEQQCIMMKMTKRKYRISVTRILMESAVILQ